MNPVILKLLLAIRMLESSDGKHLESPCGLAHGPYQLTQPFITDCNKWAGTAFTLTDAYDELACRKMILTYFRHYQAIYRGRHEGDYPPVTYYARIFRKGYRGRNTKTAWSYAKKAVMLMGTEYEMAHLKDLKRRNRL